MLSGISITKMHAMDGLIQYEGHNMVPQNARLVEAGPANRTHA